MRASYRAALGGITAALQMISLIGAFYLPTGKVALYALSGFFLFMPLSKRLWGTATLSYIATGLIGALVNPLMVLPYLFTALHPFVVTFFLTRKKRVIWLEYIAKIAFFLIALVAVYYLMPIIVGENFLTGLPFWVYALAGTAVFVVYDVLVTRIAAKFGIFLDRFMHS